MQAVILAAGMGRRLKELTKDNTKCMVEVNGVTLAERALRILDRKGLSKIILVTGYRRENLEQFVDSLSLNTPVIYIRNQVYDKTNNIYSLLLAKEYLKKEDTLLLESDLIFEESVIDEILEDPRDTLALVDHFESWMDGTCVVIDDEDRIVDFIAGKYLHYTEKTQYYKTVNIYKFSSHFSEKVYIPFTEAYLGAMGENEYYESVIKLIAMLDGTGIRVKRLNGEIWYEIDDEQDLDIATTLFTENDEETYRLITSRYGGYWRYPKLLDFCYLVNPYYPPKKMVEEMQASFTDLLTQYPSGMRVNSMLAAKNFGVHKEHILIGNGAAELIRSLMTKVIHGKVGIIRPTFEEYFNRYAEETVIYQSTEEGFRYSVSDLIDYFGANRVDWLCLINPDNPSGNYIPHDELTKLLDWTKNEGVKLVVDESFLDFASEYPQGNISLIKEEILEAYPNLYVVKSISKSYGVPGLRLGVLCSADTDVIGLLKKDVSIWNINSFAEFYMQIAEKYKKDYNKALMRFRNSRLKMVEGLKKNQGLEVYPTEANYLMCRLTSGITSEQLAAKLLRENFLIKDLSRKIGDGKQYIRLAVRTTEENDRLIDTIGRIMEEK